MKDKMESKSNGNGSSEPPTEEQGSHLARIMKLEENLRALTVRLFGDEALRETWAANKAMYMAPNIPEPPQGYLQKREEKIVDLAYSIDSLQKLVDRGLTTIEKRMSFVDKVSAWIGPMMDDPKFAPPLGGAQIATKQYVDDGIERFASAIRSEVANAIEFVNRATRVLGAVAVTVAQRGAEENPIAHASRLAKLRIEGTLETLTTIWSFVQVELAKQDQPGRIQIARKMLGQIIAGK